MMSLAVGPFRPMLGCWVLNMAVAVCRAIILRHRMVSPSCLPIWSEFKWFEGLKLGACEPPRNVGFGSDGIWGFIFSDSIVMAV